MSSFRKSRSGQVVVEVMLILPVFFMMVFSIMDLGNMAHQVITANHLGYELARVGSLVAARGASRSAQISEARTVISRIVQQKFQPQDAELILREMKVTSVVTSNDPQTSGHQNEDLMLSFMYPVKLFFPISSYILASQPRSAGRRMVPITVRMPIEKPLAR